MLPPQGFRPEGEIPRRFPSGLRVYKGQYLLLKYAVGIPGKVLICLNMDGAKSLDNDEAFQY